MRRMQKRPWYKTPLGIGGIAALVIALGLVVFSCCAAAEIRSRYSRRSRPRSRQIPASRISRPSRSSRRRSLRRSRSLIRSRSLNPIPSRRRWTAYGIWRW